MKKKLIFLDIDGTLTAAGSNVPPDSALEAIKKAQKSGHKVFLCSGRNPGMLSPLLKYDFDGYVASAGGYIVIADKVIYDCPMEDEDFHTALDVLHRNGVFCTVEAKDVAYGDSNLAEFFADHTDEGNSEIERWRKALSTSLGIHDIKEYDGRPIYKVVIMCMDDKQLDEARELLEDKYDFCMQIVSLKLNKCVNGELINRKFDKGRGVRKVAEALGYDLSDTIGFGDSMNDLEMIKTVGYSVCMANGNEHLKKICDMVCDSVNNDGLAKAFNQLNLTE